MQRTSRWIVVTLGIVGLLGFVGASPLTVADTNCTVATGSSAIRCVTVTVIDTRDAPDAAASKQHWFWSESRQDQDAHMTHVEGESRMAFADDCPEEESGSECLQVTGSMSGGAVTPGRLTGHLDHLTTEGCSWSVASGCSAVFVDPDTGLPVHKHAHNRDGQWYCHGGWSAATPENGQQVLVDFKSCWKYGTWTGPPA